MANKTWTSEMLAVLKEKYPYTNTRELAAEIGLPYGAIKAKAKFLSLKKNDDYKMMPFNPFWTPERERYLIANYDNMTTKELAAHLGCTHSAVKNRCFGLGIHKEANAGRIKKGNIPANKGKKQSEYMSPEKIAKTMHTRFKKGSVPHNANYDGHERISKYGYIEIRIRLGKYVYKHRHVWEQHHGPIPKGMVLVFKDGDKYNLAIDNLELITYAENIARMRDTDKAIAVTLSRQQGFGRGKYDKAMKEELLKYPELLDLKRAQLKLNQAIKNYEK